MLKSGLQADLQLQLTLKSAFQDGTQKLPYSQSISGTVRMTGSSDTNSYMYNKFSYRRHSVRRWSFTPFKVTDFSTDRKPACDYLLVNASNLHPISHHFQVKYCRVVVNYHFWPAVPLVCLMHLHSTIARKHVMLRNYILWTKFLSKTYGSSSWLQNLV